MHEAQVQIRFDERTRCAEYAPNSVEEVPRLDCDCAVVDLCCPAHVCVTGNHLKQHDDHVCVCVCVCEREREREREAHE